MNWIRENTFWSSIIGVLVVLVGITYYVYYSTPLQQERDKAERTISSLNQSVQQSQQAPDLEASIPPKQLIDRLKENEQKHKEDIGQLSLRLLELGKGIEEWFEQNRFPNPGFFESIYQERRGQLTQVINRNLASADEEGDGGFLGGNDDEDEQRIDWPDNPTENMQKTQLTQKKFWIIKRLVRDILFVEASSLQELSFEGQPDPVTVLDGQTLLQRYGVSGSITLPPEQVGRFLARLVQVDTGEEDTPNLMMHVKNYRLVKRRTTPRILSNLEEAGQDAFFTFPLVISGDLNNWQLSSAELPPLLQKPSNVKLEFGIIVYDPHEPTLVTLLKEAGYGNEDLKEVFQPFYSSDEFNRFTNGNN